MKNARIDSKTTFGIALLVTLLLSSTAAAGSVVIQDGQVSASSDFNASSVLYVNSATGSVGIGTAASQRPLHISAAQDANIRLQDTLGASPAAYVEFYNDTTRWGYVGLGGHDDKMVVGTTAEKNLAFYANNSQKMILTAAGYVGIGTTSPSQMLDVAGNLTLSGGLKQILFSDAGNYDFSIVHNGGVSLDFRSPEYNGTTVMSITNAGYIGIGTASPATKLHVDGGRLTVRSNAEAYALGIGRTDQALKDFFLGTQATSGDLQFSAASGTALMTVQQAGKVGIGTASPNATLHVAGTIQIDTGGGTALQNQDGVGNTLWQIKRGSNNDMAMRAYGGFSFAPGNSDSTLIQITSGGRVGIGTTSPTQKFVVSDPNGADNIVMVENAAVPTRLFMQAQTSPAQGAVGTLTNHPLQLMTYNTNRVTIDTNGNVGIGTTTPTTKLDVAGKITESVAWGTTLAGTKTKFKVPAYYSDGSCKQGYLLIAQNKLYSDFSFFQVGFDFVNSMTWAAGSSTQYTLYNESSCSTTFDVNSFVPAEVRAALYERPVRLESAGPLSYGAYPRLYATLTMLDWSGNNAKMYVVNQETGSVTKQGYSFMSGMIMGGFTTQSYNAYSNITSS